MENETIQIYEKNVLVIDDSPTVRHKIKLILKRARLFDNHYEAEDATIGLSIMGDKHIDLVICDVVMPGMDGFEFLQQMKSTPQWRDIPVIMLTGQDQIQQKIYGLDTGASDYLTKPFNHGELIARVRVQLKVKQLQDELKIAKQRYKELSVTDFLTQIYNRRHFMDLFNLEFARSKRYGLDLSLIIMDIDNFKHINDTYGHLQGDKVLREISAIIKTVIRTNDTFARYGGEEFVLMLPQTNLDGSLQVAEKIRQKIEEKNFEGPGRITISLGAACYPCLAIEEQEALIKAADNALYEAKRRGKNCVAAAERQ